MMPTNGIPGQPGGNNQGVRMPAQSQSAMARYTGRDARPAGQAMNGQGRLRQLLGRQPARRQGPPPHSNAGGMRPAQGGGQMMPMPTATPHIQPAQDGRSFSAVDPVPSYNRPYEPVDQSLVSGGSLGGGSMITPELGAGGLPYGTPQVGSSIAPYNPERPPMGGDNIQYATSPVRSEGYMLPGFTGGSVGALPQQRGTPQQRGRGQGQGALRSMLARQRVRGGGGRMNMGQPRKYPTQIPVQQPASGVDALRTMVGR